MDMIGDSLHGALERENRHELPCIQILAYIKYLHTLNTCIPKIQWWEMPPPLPKLKLSRSAVKKATVVLQSVNDTCYKGLHHKLYKWMYM